MLPLVGWCTATLPRTPPPLMALPSWVPPACTAEISETEAQAAFSGMQTVELTLPTAVASGPVVTRYLKTAVEPSPEEEPPLLLVHGFDISLALEYRRLLPLLEALGIEGYAPCIAGWGFTETTNLRSVRVEAKRAHLLAFWRSVLGSRPAVGWGLRWAPASPSTATAPNRAHSVHLHRSRRPSSRRRRPSCRRLSADCCFKTCSPRRVCARASPSRPTT